METNRSLRVTVEAELKKLSRKEPPVITVPQSHKKRKLSEKSEHNDMDTSSFDYSVGTVISKPKSYTNATLTGISQLDPELQQAANPGKFQELFKNIMKPKSSPKNPILRGNCNHGTSVLSANVDLVATGIALNASTDDLKSYLSGKDLETIEVVQLTRQEVIDSGAVRSKTMKVTIKAMDLENAKLPETWPMRVGIRHFRAPPRPRNTNDGWAEQSSRTGGSYLNRENGDGVFQNRDRRNRRANSVNKEQETVTLNKEQLTMVSNMFGALQANMECP